VTTGEMPPLFPVMQWVQISTLSIILIFTSSFGCSTIPERIVNGPDLLGPNVYAKVAIKKTFENLISRSLEEAGVNAITEGKLRRSLQCGN
jgi:hypothetical protein